MTHRGPFQPLPFCDSVTLNTELEFKQIGLASASHNSKSSLRSPWKKLWKSPPGFLPQSRSEALAEVRYLGVMVWLLTGSPLLSGERPKRLSLVLPPNNFPYFAQNLRALSKVVLQRVVYFSYSSIVALCEC